MAKFVKGQIPWNKGIKCPRHTEDELNQHQKQWRDENRSKRNEALKKWRASNPDAAKKISERARKKNAGRVMAANAEYRASKLQRTPAWLTKDDMWLIKEAYELAQARTKLHGFSWHVDHIIPLKGKKVCGLHVPNNLQVIEGKINIMKNNKLLEGELF